jgi:hypothetical protein
MNTFYIHNAEGLLVGWIDAVDAAAAQAIAECHYDDGDNVTISTHPDGEWYCRRETPPKVEELAFAA